MHGSGHFVVAAFNVIATLRMYEERISPSEAAQRTISDNIFGLELDPRCTQIAALILLSQHGNLLASIFNCQK